MKKIIRYEAVNGHIFKTAKEAKKMDEVVRRCHAVNKLLPSAIDDSCTFANGGGYIQHTPEDIKAFTDALEDVIRFETGDKIANLFSECPTGIAGWYLSNGDAITYRLWTRCRCIDPKGREWGQPFYASNGSGKGINEPWSTVRRVRMKYTS